MKFESVGELRQSSYTPESSGPIEGIQLMSNDQIVGPYPWDLTSRIVSCSVPSLLPLCSWKIHPEIHASLFLSIVAFPRRSLDGYWLLSNRPPMTCYGQLKSLTRFNSESVHHDVSTSIPHACGILPLVCLYTSVTHSHLNYYKISQLTMPRPAIYKTDAERKEAQKASRLTWYRQYVYIFSQSLLVLHLDATS